jgi:hypothetical protein
MNGIPEGYEFVRVGRAMPREIIVGPSGAAMQLANGSASKNNIVIRLAVPACSWMKGMFRDGYLTHDAGKGICWWRDRPEYDHANQAWVGNSPVIGLDLAKQTMTKPPGFNTRLEMHDRIQPVGPKYESTMP